MIAAFRGLAVLTVLYGLLIAPCFGQSVPYWPQTLPASTVVGRSASGAGPTEAIPYSVFATSISSSLLAGTNVFSGNNTFSGTTTFSGSISLSGGAIFPVANGGTGLASYTTGDILYASAPTTIGKLADVATGSVLISGGVGVAPLWSSTLSLTTGFTGPTLSGGTAAGSTLTLQSTSGTGTSDSIIFKTGSQVTKATIDTKGHIGFAGTAPSVGTCGTSPAITGTDTAAQVTMGSTATTACTVTFANAYAAAPICVASPSGGTAIGNFAITSTTTTLVASYSSSTSLKFSYVCHGL